MEKYKGCITKANWPKAQKWLFLSLLRVLCFPNKMKCSNAYPRRNKKGIANDEKRQESRRSYFIFYTPQKD